jgi:dolichol-phosphate mannosyltransferase
MIEECVSESSRSVEEILNNDHGAAFVPVAVQLRFSERFLQFIKFCIVGGSGTAVDMAMLYLLADPRSLGLNVTLSKFCAAEIALVNNFVWNEVWTFKSEGVTARGLRGVLRRLLLFNGICGAGICLAVLLLNFFHTWLGWNLYLSNLLAVGIVTLWNFGLNARFNWRAAKTQ